MSRDDSLYLQHILDAVERIEQYTQGFDQQKFNENLLVQDGVIRQVTVIGEAVKLLSNEVQDKYTHVPWDDIAGMRDKLIHRYFGIDLEKVWLTVRDDLPILKKDVTKILEELQKQQKDSE